MLAPQRARISPARPGFGFDPRWLRWRLPTRAQRKLKRAARPGIPSRPYVAAVLLDNRPADRKAYAHAVRLCREEGAEQPVHILRLDSGTGILDRNKYPIGPVLLRSYPQLVTAAWHRIRGLNAIHQKIHYDLL